jgi:hypothetical protein
MARKRGNWGPKGEEILADGAKRGLGAPEIASLLAAAGVKGASQATVQRRLRDHLGARRSSKSSAVAKAVPMASPIPSVVLDAVPSDPEDMAEATPAELDWWLAEVKEAFEQAKIDGNTAAQASLAARATALLEAKRKSAPPEVVDPNDALDIREAAARGRALFFSTLENLIGNRVHA